MALDWNMEIGGSKSKANRKDKDATPTKSVMNLAQREAVQVDLRKALVVGLALLVAIALFTKFGVLDFYDRLGAKQAELSSYTSQLTAAQEQLKDYDAVAAEYAQYMGIVDALGASVDIPDALNMLDRTVGTNNVSSVDFQENVLTIQLSDNSLENLAAKSQVIANENIVRRSQVSTAVGNGVADSASIVITLKTKAEIADEQNAAAAAAASGTDSKAQTNTSAGTQGKAADNA